MTWPQVPLLSNCGHRLPSRESAGLRGNMPQYPPPGPPHSKASLLAAHLTLREGLLEKSLFKSTRRPTGCLDLCVP